MSKTTSCWAALAAALILLGPHALTAQTAQNAPPTREGFWISLSAGWGSVGFTCDGCPDIDREMGTSGNLRLGTALNPNILLGVEITGWTQWWDDSGANFLRSSLLGAVTVYPMTTGGLFLAAGAGYTVYSEKLDPDEVTVNGVGGMVRLGYDIRVAKNFSVSPYGDFEMTFGGTLKANGADTGVSGNTNLFSLGVAVTFH